MASFPPALLTELQQLVGPAHVIHQGETLEQLSKDFYWYSPILKDQLKDKRADAVVRPGSLDELKAVVAACSRARVPVVPRGGGTGNYGQCIPLYGGVVLDITRLDRVLEITADGVVRAEPGARLIRVETEVRKLGWEMRCLPSTFVKSTFAGFLCGGFGGIGTITWGTIVTPGNVKALTLLTCDENPRLVRLEETECDLALHTYGTTGLVVEIEMRLAPRLDYDQVILSGANWDKLIDWTDACAHRGEWRKRLVTALQWPIPSFFKPLQKRFRSGEHVVFLLADRAQCAEIIASAAAAGVACVYHTPLVDPLTPPFITDYTWNHATLWAMKSEPSFTNIQANFGPNFREQSRLLQQRFPGEIVHHYEWMAARPRLVDGPSPYYAGEDVSVGAVPLIYYRSKARLQEISDYCAEIGIVIDDPHTYVLEDGGRIPNLEGKRALRNDVDPAGLLNPGKMRTASVNPFVPA